MEHLNHPSPHFNDAKMARFVLRAFIIRELKQRRFWAADVDRKFMFLLLARFHARPMSYKALILTFTTWLFQWKGWNTHERRGSLDFRLTSVAQKRLCFILSKIVGQGNHISSAVSKMLSFHPKTKSRRLKCVFQKLRFRDGLVWTAEGLTVEIKLCCQNART